MHPTRKRKLEQGQLVWIRVLRSNHQNFTRLIGGRGINYFKVIKGSPVAGTYIRKALAKDYSFEERRFMMSSGRSLAKGLSEKSSVILTPHGLMIVGNDLIVTRIRRST